MFDLRLRNSEEYSEGGKISQPSVSSCFCVVVIVSETYFFSGTQTVTPRTVSNICQGSRNTEEEKTMNIFF